MQLSASFERITLLYVRTAAGVARVECTLDERRVRLLDRGDEYAASMRRSTPLYTSIIAV